MITGREADRQYGLSGGHAPRRSRRAQDQGCQRPVGTFHYEKRLAKKEVLCQVRVFLFRVDRQLDDWPEKSQRETKWFDANEAANIVDEGGLAEIIERFAGSYVRLIRFSKYELRHGRRHFLNQSGL
jgi:hypothetical protein